MQSYQTTKGENTTSTCIRHHRDSFTREQDNPHLQIRGKRNNKSHPQKVDWTGMRGSDAGTKREKGSQVRCGDELPVLPTYHSSHNKAHHEGKGDGAEEGVEE